MKFSELKTSEGRAHIIGQIILIYAGVHGFIPPALAAKISVIAFSVYAAVRALVKVVEAVSPTLAKSPVVAEVEADMGKIMAVLPPTQK